MEPFGGTQHQRARERTCSQPSGDNGAPLGWRGWNLNWPLLMDAGGIRIAPATKSCRSELHRSIWTPPLGST